MLLEHHRNNQNMQQAMRNMETDLMNRLKEQRETHMKLFEAVEDEKQKLMRQSGERTEISNNMMRDILITIERKVQDEVSQRQRDQLDAKQAVEQKMVQLVEKLRSDERLALEREKRLMEQVQEGLNTMNEIIKGTKEQNQVNLSHQTTIMGEQLG